MGYIRNAIMIAVPLADVFRITNNVLLWPELFSEYAQSEIIEQHADTVVFRLTMHPDEQGVQRSWVARRTTDAIRYSTYSERTPPAPPFDSMVIRWWYDALDADHTLMTWEQEFHVSEQASVSDAQVTAHLDTQTKVQQRLIKQKLEQQAGTASAESEPPLHRGVIIGRYLPDSESKIADAFRRSDATDLPYLVGVRSRHIWVLGGIEVHFLETTRPLPEVMREFGKHPLFKDIKAEADQYIKPLAPELNPGVGKEIYHWYNSNQAAASVLEKGS